MGPPRPKSVSVRMAVRILIVDDHDIVRQGVRTILRSRGDWEICGEAENGIEALAKIATLKPDVVVLDLSMPEKDGLAVATELPRIGVHCKTLVLTMHNSAGTAAAIRKASKSRTTLLPGAKVSVTNRTMSSPTAFDVLARAWKTK